MSIVHTRRDRSLPLPRQLQFVVPELRPDFGYGIEVRSTTRAQTAGYLRIDPASPLSVLPNQLSLEPGQRQALAFALDYPAPDGGLYINVTTDIPGSIIMPEVLIPEGARSVSAVIEGGKVGSGHLFINVSRPTRIGHSADDPLDNPVLDEFTRIRATKHSFDRIDDSSATGFFYHISAWTSTNSSHGIGRFIVHRVHYFWQVWMYRL